MRYSPIYSRLSLEMFMSFQAADCVLHRVGQLVLKFPREVKLLLLVLITGRVEREPTFVLLCLLCQRLLRRGEPRLSLDQGVSQYPSRKWFMENHLGCGIIRVYMLRQKHGVFRIRRGGKCFAWALLFGKVVPNRRCYQLQRKSTTSLSSCRVDTSSYRVILLGRT